MKLWAQIDPVVGAPLTPNKQTNKIYRPLANEQLFYALKLTAFYLLRKKTATVVPRPHTSELN